MVTVVVIGALTRHGPKPVGHVVSPLWRVNASQRGAPVVPPLGAQVTKTKETVAVRCGNGFSRNSVWMRDPSSYDGSDGESPAADVKAA